MKNLSKTCILILTVINLFGCRQPNQNVLNEQASILELNDLPENPLLLHPLSSSINPNNHTMATLYGNDLAMDHASKNKGSDYPTGARLYEVTWEQKPDSVWFGANIPKVILSVEQVVFDNNSTPVYKLYQGETLKEQAQGNDRAERLKFIISQKMAVSP